MAWAEWNGLYRDVMRRFVRGEPNLLGEVASRIAGSADLYADNGRLPCNSINFITCHDGFTLNDLVSYDGKHNEANGEENRDGSNENLSCNCGVEGETVDAAVTALRERRAKTITCYAVARRADAAGRRRGAADAARQQQRLLTGQRDLVVRLAPGRVAQRHAQVRARAHRTQAAPSMPHGKPVLHGRPVPGRDLPDVTWHGAQLHAPGWGDPNGRLLAFTIAGTGEEEDLHVILNMAEAAIDVEIPQIAPHMARAVDTARDLRLTLWSARQTPTPARTRAIAQRRSAGGAMRARTSGIDSPEGGLVAFPGYWMAVP
jgi:glycogen operon protein